MEESPNNLVSDLARRTDAFQPYESAIDAGLYDRANHQSGREAAFRLDPAGFPRVTAQLSS